MISNNRTTEEADGAETERRWMQNIPKIVFSAFSDSSVVKKLNHGSLRFSFGGAGGVGAFVILRFGRLEHFAVFLPFLPLLRGENVEDLFFDGIFLLFEPRSDFFKNGF